MIVFPHQVGNEYGQIALNWRKDGTVYLHSFAVWDPHRNQGHGRRIMERVIELANTFGFDLTLHVDPDNAPALHLYKSLGFVPADHADAWPYLRRRCDALVATS